MDCKLYEVIIALLFFILIRKMLHVLCLCLCERLEQKYKVWKENIEDKLSRKQEENHA